MTSRTTKPAHQVRPGNPAGTNGRGRRRSAPVKDRKPGHYIKVVLTPSPESPHGWPPMWTSALTELLKRDALNRKASQIVTATRAAAMARGEEWAGGTVRMPNTPTRGQIPWMGEKQ